MATKPEHKPSIAPIVGPDDPRRFTDSGIEIETVYDEDDVRPGLQQRLGELLNEVHGFQPTTGSSVAAAIG